MYVRSLRKQNSAVSMCLCQ